MPGVSIRGRPGAWREAWRGVSRVAGRSSNKDNRATGRRLTGSVDRRTTGGQPATGSVAGSLGGGLTGATWGVAPGKLCRERGALPGVSICPLTIDQGDRENVQPGAISSVFCVPCNPQNRVFGGFPKIDLGAIGSVSGRISASFENVTLSPGI